MATSISINPDVASLKKAFADVRAEAKLTQAAISSGLDTSKAIAKLDKLQASLTSYKQVLDKVSEKHKLDIDVKEATAAVDKLQRKVAEGVGSDGQAASSRRARNDAESLHRQRMSHATQEEQLRRKITQRQAEDSERAFKNYARVNPHLRQFDSYADFLKNGRAKYGQDYDRVRAATTSHVQQRAGIFDVKSDRMKRFGRAAGTIGGMAGGVIAGGGGTFGSIGGLIGGAAGMLGGPVGMIAGAVLGPVLGSIGSKLDQAMQDAVQEGLKTTNLSRAFGATVAGFEKVTDASREAAHGMLMTYGESAQHAQAFARTAALKSPDGLMQALQGSYGFGRGLGVGAGAGASFMASMRGTGAAQDEKSARRIGLSVAEAIQKGGLGPQADEVLAAVQNFATTATHASFRAPDVGAFSSMLAAGSNLNLPGLHASGMASIIGGVDSSIRNGGNFGQASETVSLNAIANLDPNLNVYAARRVMQGGAFGTIAGAYGKDSAVVKEAQGRLDAATASGDTQGAAQARAELQRYGQYASGANANVTNLDAQMQMFRGMDGDAAARMMGNHFGLSMDQASVLRSTFGNAGDGGKLMERLGAMGIDVSKVNMGGAFHMASVLNGGHDVLEETRSRMLKGDGFKSLSASQKKALEGAQGDSELRNVLLKTLNEVGGAVSASERSEQAQIDMKNSLSRIADQLIPATTAMKDGIGALVEKMAPNTAYGKKLRHDREVQEEIDSGKLPLKTVEAYSAYAEKLRDQKKDGGSFGGWLSGLFSSGDDPKPTGSRVAEGKVTGAPATAAASASIPGASAAAASQRGKSGRLLPSAVGSRSKEALDYFVAQGWSKEQAAGIVANLGAESKHDETAVGDGGSAYGIAQWHPDRQREFKKFAGKDIVGSSYQDQLAFVNHELTAGNEQGAGARLKQAKTAADAGSIVSQYYERPADRYGQAASRARDANAIYAAGIPDGGAAARGAQTPEARTDARAVASSPGKIDLNIKLTVADTKGAPSSAATADVTGAKYSPAPAGV